MPNPFKALSCEAFYALLVLTSTLLVSSVLNLAQKSVFAIVIGLVVVISLFYFLPRLQHWKVMMGIHFLALILAPLVLLTLSRSPDAATHDSVLMTQSAANLLLSGRDPYNFDYVHTLARIFFLPEVAANFGLDSFVYTPLPILMDLPLQALHLSLAWLYPIFAFVLLIAAWNMGTTPSRSLAAAAALVFNPLFVFDYLSLFQDIFFLSLMLAALAALNKQRPLLAALLFALSLAAKQEAILLFPFFLAYSFYVFPRKSFYYQLLLGAGLLVVVILPFFIWNPTAFIHATAGYFYGKGNGLFPIRGYGLPGTMLFLGLIPNRWEAFPSALLQVIFCLPLLGFLIWKLNTHRNIASVLVYGASFTLAIFFFGRSLSPNYWDLIFIFFMAAFALRLSPQPTPTTPTSPALAKPS